MGCLQQPKHEYWRKEGIVGGYNLRYVEDTGDECERRSKWPTPAAGEYPAIEVPSVAVDGTVSPIAR